MIPKFRAWLTDKYIGLTKSVNVTLVSPRMCEVVEVIRHHKDNNLAFAGVHVILRHGDREERDYKRIEVPDEATLMMSTGMKDANGKEIFEGDIVECGFSSDQKDLVTGIVEYNPEYSGFTIDDLSIGYMTAEYGFEYYKILGNKYENPELLKEE